MTERNPLTSNIAVIKLDKSIRFLDTPVGLPFKLVNCCKTNVRTASNIAIKVNEAWKTILIKFVN